MFDLGFFELLLIGMVALLVVGPDRLPAVATFVGHWVGRLRSMANHMRREIRQELEAEHLKSLLADQNRELDELRREVEGIRDETASAVRSARKETEDVMSDARKETEDAMSDARKAVEDDSLETEDTESRREDIGNAAGDDGSADGEEPARVGTDKGRAEGEQTTDEPRS